tara:strand:+ start:2379 stop:2507 length:129 start_codon:yes stop_codon:yes gene_type:complete
MLVFMPKDAASDMSVVVAASVLKSDVSAASQGYHSAYLDGKF